MDRSSTGWTFHILSFEGPDRYASAGGIATRITGLANALADGGFDTHLWFIGDPDLPGHESRGRLTLHRWCQWISSSAPRGVYDQEMAKQQDYSSSLPPYLLQTIRAHLANGGRAAVLAEEWHTYHAVLHLDWLLRREDLRDRVQIFWNANNTFGFERIDWGRLSAAATVTTVSRYMRHRMWALGVDALVVPNGIAPEILRPAAPAAVRALREGVAGRVVLTKVARWDPDKRWLLAIDTLAALRREGGNPLLIARGGMEAHADEVLRRAMGLGLRISRSIVAAPGAAGLLKAVRGVPGETDIMLLDAPLDRDACRLLFGGSSAVLANSGHEPFGLVGLETMAAGGVACTGGTGEDYAVPGRNSLMLQTVDPLEFVRQFQRLRADAGEERALRRNGMATAQRFTWTEIVRRNLLPLLGIAVPRDAPSRPQPPGGALPRLSRVVAAVEPAAGRFSRSAVGSPSF